jgi:thiol-disulfide isomerase/thioredoxin
LFGAVGAAAGAAGIGLAWWQRRLAPALAPEQAALWQLQFLTPGGAPLAMRSFAGKPLLLNFWATWCPPCVAEMPALDRLHAALAEARIIVVAASQDRGGANVVRPFYERTGVQHLPVWLDPRGAAGRAFGIRGLPTTVVLNRSGREVARLEGEATWDAPAMLDRLRALLPAAVPAAPETTAT